MDNIRITIETNANDAAKTFENLANSFNDTDAQAVDLRKQIRGLKDDLYKLEPGTEEYGRVLGELGAKMNQLGDTQRELRAASGGLDTVFQTTTVAVSDLASGFQAAVGICTLFGVESEDLMKTLVKLQAVMSIVNGLKGFAGFFKNARTALISVKAFQTATKVQTAALTESTVALGSNTAATGLNAAASKTAAVATGTLRAVLDKLKNAILGVNAAMGIVVVAVAALAAALVALYRHSNQVQAQMEENDRLIGLLSEDTLTYEERNRNLDSEFQAQLKTYAKVTKSQEALTEIQKKYYTEQLRSAYAMRKAAVEQARYYETTTAFKDKLEEAQKQIQETTDRIKELESAVKDLDAQDLAGWSIKMISEFDEYDRGVERSLARGEISDSTAIKRRIRKRQDMLNDLQEIDEKYYHGTVAQIDEAQELAKKYSLYNILGSEDELTALKARLQSEIDELGDALDDYNDRQAKYFSETNKKLLESQAKKFEEFTAEFVKEKAKVWTSVQGFDEQMTQLFENVGLNAEEARGKAKTPLTLIRTDIDVFTAQWRDKALELYDANKISKEGFDEFINGLNTTAASMKDLVQHITGDLRLTDYADVLNDNLLIDANDLRKTLTALDEMQKQGLINSVEYQNAYLSAITNFKSVLVEDKDEVKEYISQILSGELLDKEAFTDMNGDTQTLRQFLEANGFTPEGYAELLGSLFTQSATVLPPEFRKNMVDNVRKIIDAQMQAAEDEYEKEVNRINARSLSTDNDIFDMFWGASEGQTYMNVKALLDDTFAAYEKRYNDEIASLEQSMSLYDEGTAEYEEYLNRKKALDEGYAQAHAQYLHDVEDNEHAHLSNLMSNISSVALALGSMGSALSDYYDEMANGEKLSVEEQQKYARKSIEMKKFQAIANISSGIVAAIAGAMELGFPMGPIVAAVQSAAVAASGATQIAAINKQIRELGGSAGSDSTPNAAGMVDRVIMANAQNTDQREQLNAQYGLQGDMRVYVTQSDLDNGRKSRSVAVTQNGF